METLQKVSHVGCDLHKKFTIATARDAQNRLLWRQRLEHADWPRLRAQLGTWPKGTPVIFEASFGWGWFADAVQAAQLEPHLASSRKVAAWRAARGLAKSNRLDADLLSELWDQQPRWWEVWLAPPAVREQREWLRYTLVAEIGRIERFPNSKHLASYSLLAPRAYDSGEPEDGPPQGRSRRAGRLRRTPNAEVGVHRGGARSRAAWRPVPAVV